jgi:hypothetical protein
MVVYKHKANPAIKWIIAIVIFVLAMTITFADADGATLISNLF